MTKDWKSYKSVEIYPKKKPSKNDQKQKIILIIFSCMSFFFLSFHFILFEQFLSVYFIVEISRKSYCFMYLPQFFFCIYICIFLVAKAQQLVAAVVSNPLSSTIVSTMIYRKTMVNSAVQMKEWMVWTRVLKIYAYLGFCPLI